jgi:hypothetical protein
MPSSRVSWRRPARRPRPHPNLADALRRDSGGLRITLREAVVKTNELLQGMKRQRRQSRALETTLASLRQLKGLGV